MFYSCYLRAARWFDNPPCFLDFSRRILVELRLYVSKISVEATLFMQAQSSRKITTGVSFIACISSI